MESISAVRGAGSRVNSADTLWRQVLSRVQLWQKEARVSLLLMWAIRLGVVLLFVTPLVVTTSTIFPFVVGKAIWSRSLIEVIVGIYILLAMRSPAYRPTRSRIVMLFGVHLGALVVAGVFGSSFNLSFWSSYERMAGIFDLAHWVALTAVLIFTVRSLSEWKTYATLSLVFGLASGIIGLSEKYDYQIVDYLQGGDRISGTFGNPSFLAGHMMLNAMLAMALLTDRLSMLRVRTGRTELGFIPFYAVNIVVSLWALAETGTRGSAAGLLAGLVLALALLVYFSSKPGIRVAAGLIGIAVPITLIGIFMVRDTAAIQDLAESSPIVDRALSISLEGGSEDLRVTGLRIAGEAVAARPLTGWGGENFEVPFQSYQLEGEVPQFAPILDRAHNKPLDLLATTGLIGFISYMAMWTWLGVLAWRRVRDEPEIRPLNSFVSGTILALFIHNLFLFDTAVTLLMFGLFAAWASSGELSSTSSDPGRLQKVRFPRSAQMALRSTATMVVVTVVVLGVYGLNFRMYRAAQLVTETAPTVQMVSDNLSHFSPMSTFARERLLNVMSGRWNEMDVNDRIQLIRQLEEEAATALSAEPENMELHFAVARFYRVVALDLPVLMDKAREHTDRGVALGPHTSSSARAAEEQLLAEDALNTAGS